MKAKVLVLWVLVCFVSLTFLTGSSALAAEKPIVIGAPLATAFLYGWTAERAAGWPWRKSMPRAE